MILKLSSIKSWWYNFFITKHREELYQNGYSKRADVMIFEYTENCIFCYKWFFTAEESKELQNQYEVGYLT